MRRDGAVRMLLAALVVATVVGGCLAIQALERARKLNLQAITALRRLEERLANPPAPDGNLRPDDGRIANREFFVPGAKVGGELRSCIAAEPPNLNPLISNEATAMDIYSMCIVSLAERAYDRPDGEFLPLAAESWTISPDRLAYHIKLRRGIMWDDFTDPVTMKRHPAREVTAEDFRFFVEVLMNPEVNCAPLRSYYCDLDGLEVIGPYEFVVRWKRPFYGSLAATLGMSPLPRHYYH